MLHERGNYSFKDPPLKEGDTVSGGNYSQAVSGTEICEGVKNLTITGGNFTNCKRQDSWKVSGGNWAQIDFCSNNHPDMGLEECSENCRHRSEEMVLCDIEDSEIRKRKMRGHSLLSIKSNPERDSDGVLVIRHTVEKYKYTDKVL